MEFFRVIVHYFLHFGFPLVLAFAFFRKDWKKAYFLMLMTMLVDLDHLFATPIFDPNRCSINYHYLHSYWAIAIYICLLFFKGNLRIIAVGLLFHMLTDYMDCWFGHHL